MKNGSHHKKSIFILFLSERHLSRKKTSFVLFALPNASEKEENKIVPFDYMKNGSHHKKNFFLFFLNVIFLEKKTSFVLFALPNASEKDKKIVPFDYMKNGSLHKKSKFFVPFLTSF